MDEWMEHRDALYTRAVHRGRVLQWRRRIASGSALLAVVGVAVLGVGTLTAGSGDPASVNVAAGPTSTASTSSTSTATTGTTSTTSTTVPQLSPQFVGTWVRHGIDLQFAAGGRMTMNWRTYKVCGQTPPPCDQWVGSEINDGGHASITLHATGPATAAGTVLTSSDPSMLPVGPVTASLDEKNDLLFVDPFPGADAPFCGPRATDQRCGA